MNKRRLTPLDKSNRPKKNYLTGLTLLEILVSVIILGLVVTGLANIFMSGKRSILHSRSKTTATELGRYFLDPLQMQVRQDTWSTSCLGTGTAANCPSQTIGTAEGLDRNYTANYTVTPDSPITNLSKVKVNITWTEPSP